MKSASPTTSMRTLLIPSIIAAASTCFAASVYLIDGTVYNDCKIVYSTNDEVVIRYPDPEKPSISREVSLKKSAILKQTKSSPEEKEFEDLERTLRKTSSLKKEELSQAISSTEDFMKRYPNGVYSFKLKGLLASARATLQEMEQTNNGEDQQPPAGESDIITPDEQDRYRFDMDADRIYKSMMKFSEKHKEVEALQMFSLLEKMKGASCYPNAKITAIKLIGILETRWKKQKTNAANAQESMENKVQRMKAGPKKSKAMNFIRAQQVKQKAEFQKKRDEARKTGYRWFIPSSDNVYALESAWSFAQQERRRLTLKSTNEPVEGKASPLIRDFWKAVDARDIDTARIALTNLKNLGYTAIPAEYTEPMSDIMIKLQRDLSQQRAEARAASARKAREQAETERRKNLEEARKQAEEERLKRLEAFQKSEEEDRVEQQRIREERTKKFANKASEPTSQNTKSE